MTSASSSPRDVVSPGLAAELRALLPWALVALAAWVGLAGYARRSQASRGPERAPWQRSYLELSPAEQRLYRDLRAGLFDVENERAWTKQWPDVPWLVEQGVPPFAPDALTPALEWSRSQQLVYVNYLGVPKTPGGLRWLVLFIEPEKQAFGETTPPPPPDEEHHTLSDGTALHVTVWTMPNEGPLPDGVLAFPVGEGWTQRLGR
jgi:hypothetical protein